MKFDFSKVKLKDVQGVDIKLDVPFHQTIANQIYSVAADLGLVTKAQEMYKGNVVDFNEAEITEVKALIEKKGANGEYFFFAFTRKALLDYIQSVQEVDKK